MVPSAVSAEISELRWQGLALDDQRMVARGLKILRQIAKDRLRVVMNLARFAVHDLRRANHSSAEGRANGLMSQADAQNRDFAGKALDQRDADARFVAECTDPEKSRCAPGGAARFPRS